MQSKDFHQDPENKQMCSEPSLIYGCVLIGQRSTVGMLCWARFPSPLCMGAPFSGGGPVSTICLHLLIGFGQWEAKAGVQRAGEQWGWVFNPVTSSQQGGPERAGLSSQSQRPSQAAHPTQLQLTAPHHPSSLRMNGNSLMQVRRKFGRSTGLSLHPLLCNSCLCKQTFLELSYFESAIYFLVGTD